MKNASFLSLLILALFFLSCGRIKNVESLDGMVGLPPVRSVQNNDSTLLGISGELSFPLNSPRKGRILRDSAEINNKFKWLFPKIAGNCDIDLHLSRSSKKRSAISLGFMGYYLESRLNWMWRLGYAFESNSRLLGMRFDIGISRTNLRNVRFPEWHDFIMPYPGYNRFSQNNKASSIESVSGRYMSLTLGYHQPDSRLKVNLQGAFCWQGIAGDNSLIPDNHGEYGVGLFYFILSPFISYGISLNTSLTGGFRLISESGIDNPNGPFLILPFIQYEFGI